GVPGRGASAQRELGQGGGGRAGAPQVRDADGGRSGPPDAGREARQAVDQRTAGRGAGQEPQDGGAAFQLDASGPGERSGAGACAVAGVTRFSVELEGAPDVRFGGAGDAHLLLGTAVAGMDGNVARTDADGRGDEAADGVVGFAAFGRSGDADLEAVAQGAGDLIARGAGDGLHGDHESA